MEESSASDWWETIDQNEEPTVLPILEIDFSGFPEELGRVLGQKAKSVFDDSSNYKCPANIDEPLRKRIESPREG